MEKVKECILCTLLSTLRDRYEQKKTQKIGLVASSSFSVMRFTYIYNQIQIYITTMCDKHVTDSEMKLTTLRQLIRKNQKILLNSQSG